MTLADKFRNICVALGKNNKPTYAVMAIATVKGICRPAFTMMDKTEKPETKRYTAVREGLTELIAIPAYWACGEIAGKCAKLFVKREDFLSENIKNQIKKGIKGPQIDKALNIAAEQAEKNGIKAANNLRFVGVCTAALFIIPALCSVAIKPLMSKIIKPPSANDTKEVLPDAIQKLNIKSNKKPDITTFGSSPYRTLNSYISRPQAGLRVGGL